MKVVEKGADIRGEIKTRLVKLNVQRTNFRRVGLLDVAHQRNMLDQLFRSFVDFIAILEQIEFEPVERDVTLRTRNLLLCFAENVGNRARDRRADYDGNRRGKISKKNIGR